MELMAGAIPAIMHGTPLKNEDHMNTNTKMILAALGIASLIATPALAQKQTHRGHVATPYAATVNTPVISSEGRVIGTDPDPSIRSELARDATTYTSSN